MEKLPLTLDYILGLNSDVIENVNKLFNMFFCCFPLCIFYL